METEVARGKVELLVVGGIVGDMHLAVDACYLSVALEHDGSVVVQTWCALLEERGDEDHTELLGQLAEESRRGPGNGLCEVEIVYVFCLAEIK